MLRRAESASSLDDGTQSVVDRVSTDSKRASKQQASMEEAIFGSLYAMIQKKKQVSPKLALIEFLIEILSLIAFSLNSKLASWDAASISTLRHIITVFEFEEYAISTDVSQAVTLFWITIGIVVSCVAALIFVAISFRRNSFTVIWPLQFLQLAGRLVFVTLFLPFLNNLLMVWDCDYSTSPAMLSAMPGYACWSPYNAVCCVISLLVLLAFIFFSLVMTVVDFESSPESKELTAAPHSTAEFRLLLCRVLFAFSQIILSASAVLLSIANVALGLHMTWVIYSNIPYYRPQVNFVRCGCYSAVTWAALCLFALVNHILTPAQSSAVVLIGLIPSFLFGYLLTSYRLLAIQNKVNVATVGQLTSRLPAERQETVTGGYQNVQNVSENDPIREVLESDLITEVIARCLFKPKTEPGPESIELADKIFRLGVQTFPSSAYLHVCYARFLEIYLKRSDLSQLYLDRAGYLNPSVMLKFIIYHKLKEKERARQAQNLGTASMDLVGLVQFQKNSSTAKRFHVQALRGIKSFWTKLLQHNVDLEELALLIQRVDRAESRAAHGYQSLMKKYPNYPRLLRTYASFLADVKNDTVAARKMFSKASFMEDLANQERSSVDAKLQVQNATDKQIVSSSTSVTSSDALATIDAVGNIVNVNTVFCKMFGYAKQDILGRNISVITPSPFAELHHLFMQRYHLSAVPSILGKGRRNLWGKHSDGTCMPIYLSVTRLDVDGERLFAGIIEKREQRGYMISTDQTGSIVGVSKNSCKLLRYQPDGIVGNSIVFLRPADCPLSTTEFVTLLQSPVDPNTPVDLEFLSSLGDSIQVRLNHVAIFPLERYETTVYWSIFEPISESTSTLAANQDSAVAKVSNGPIKPYDEGIGCPFSAGKEYDPSTVPHPLPPTFVKQTSQPVLHPQSSIRNIRLNPISGQKQVQIQQSHHHQQEDNRHHHHEHSTGHNGHHHTHTAAHRPQPIQVSTQMKNNHVVPFGKPKSPMSDGGENQASRKRLLTALRKGLLDRSNSESVSVLKKRVLFSLALLIIVHLGAFLFEHLMLNRYTDALNRVTVAGERSRRLVSIVIHTRSLEQAWINGSDPSSILNLQSALQLDANVFEMLHAELYDSRAMWSSQSSLYEVPAVNVSEIAPPLSSPASHKLYGLWDVGNKIVKASRTLATKTVTQFLPANTNPEFYFLTTNIASSLMPAFDSSLELYHESVQRIQDLILGVHSAIFPLCLLFVAALGAFLFRPAISRLHDSRLRALNLFLSIPKKTIMRLVRRATKVSKVEFSDSEEDSDCDSQSGVDSRSDSEASDHEPSQHEPVFKARRPSALSAHNIAKLSHSLSDPIHYTPEPDLNGTTAQPTPEELPLLSSPLSSPLNSTMQMPDDTQGLPIRKSFVLSDTLPGQFVSDHSDLQTDPGSPPCDVNQSKLQFLRKSDPNVYNRQLSGQLSVESENNHAHTWAVMISVKRRLLSAALFCCVFTAVYFGQSFSFSLGDACLVNNIVTVANRRAVLADLSNLFSRELVLDLIPSGTQTTAGRAAARSQLESDSTLASAYHRGLVFGDSTLNLPGSKFRYTDQSQLLYDPMCESINVSCSISFPADVASLLSSALQGGLDSLFNQIVDESTLLTQLSDSLLATNNTAYRFIHEAYPYLTLGLNRSIELYKEEAESRINGHSTSQGMMVLAEFVVVLVILFMVIRPVVNYLAEENRRVHLMLAMIPADLVDDVKAIREFLLSSVKTDIL